MTFKNTIALATLFALSAFSALAQQSNDPSGTCSVSSTAMIISSQSGNFACRPSYPGSASGTWSQVKIIYPQAITYYPNGLPATTTGTSTVAECQTLVNYIASVISQRVIDNSAVLRVLYRMTSTGGTNGGTVTANSQTVTVNNLTSVTEAVPVDVMNLQPTLRDELATRLAAQLAHTVDTTALALYGSFTTLSAVGAAGSAMTTATLDLAIAALGTTGEPIFLFVTPESFIASSEAVGAPLTKQSYINALPYGPDSPYGNYKRLRIIPTDAVVSSGTGPSTWQNLAITPSAIGFVSNVGAATTSATVATANSTFGGINCLVTITNTGTGVQTVTVSMLAGAFVLTGGLTKGQQVRN